MTDFRAAGETVNQMLVSHKRVGLWWDEEFMKTSAAATGGFIHRRDLTRLPSLGIALVCVTAAQRTAADRRYRTEAGAAAGGGGDRLPA